MTAEPTVVDTDVQCGRCGSSAFVEPCDNCDAEGLFTEIDEEGFDVEYPCDDCNGTGRFVGCCATDGWCKNHPRPGREDVAPGTPEWFEVLSDGTTRIVERP